MVWREERRRRGREEMELSEGKRRAGGIWEARLKVNARGAW
jgi:hypothetical protein